MGVVLPLSNGSQPIVTDTSFITSLYSRAYYLMMNVRWLNPSHVQTKDLTQVGKSIAETFQLNMDKLDTLLETKPRTDKFYRYFHRPVAGAARIAISIGFSLYIAPIGVVFNGAITAFYVAKYNFTDKVLKKVFVDNIAKYNESMKSDWNHAAERFKGFSCDLLMGFPLLSKNIVSRLPPSVIIVLLKILRNLPSQVTLFIFAGIITLLTAPIFTPFKSEYILALSTNSDHRMGIHQSLLLGKEYGIYGPQGLLKHSTVDDETLAGEGFFFGLYMNTATEIITKLSRIKEAHFRNLKKTEHYKRYPEVVLQKFELNWKHHVPTGEINLRKGISKGIKVENKQSHNINEAIEKVFDPRVFSGDIQSDFEVLPVTQEELFKLFDRFFKLRELMTELSECQPFFFSDPKQPFDIPRFFTRTGINHTFASAKLASEDWLKLLEDLTKEISLQKNGEAPIFATKPEFTDLYKNFRTKVIMKLAPEELLKIKDGDAENMETFKANYRKLLLAIHPDKLPSASQSLKDEATALFDILQQAIVKVGSQ